MNDDTSGNTSKTELVTDWRRLRAMTDEEVHAAVTADPDIMSTDETLLEGRPCVIIPHQRETVMMDLDADVLEWFRGRRGFRRE
jgi:uncharacterized protein (DUF4415 family)